MITLAIKAAAPRGRPPAKRNQSNSDYFVERKKQQNSTDTKELKPDLDEENKTADQIEPKDDTEQYDNHLVTDNTYDCLHDTLHR